MSRRHPWSGTAAVSAALALTAVGVAAVPALTAQELDIGGEVRPRFEVRDPVPGTAPGATETREFTSMRSRLSVAVGLTEGISALVQVQDIRVWGGETGTTDPAADALDIHQAWLELGDAEAGPLALRVGRQELAYGGERLIGALDWAQQARAFDGLRLRYRPSADIVVDGLAMQVGDFDAGQPNEELVGVYATAAVAGSLDGYALFHARDEAAGPPEFRRSRDLRETWTLGTRWVSEGAGFDWRVEAAYQTGEELWRPAAAEELEPGTVSAYMMAVRVGRRLTDRLGLSVWYDHLSGDADPADGESRVFDTLFATNHKFYGLMDLFLDIPTHTSGRGLQDLALKGRYDLDESQRLGLALHSFRFAADEGLSSAHVGEELDLTYRWGYAPGVTLNGGLSYFFAGDAAPVPNAPAADERMVWGYVMIDVRF